MGEDFEQACTGLDFVLLVGPDEPSARAAADDARVIFERIRARPFLDRLDAAMARHRTDGVRDAALAPVPSSRDHR